MSDQTNGTTPDLTALINAAVAAALNAKKAARTANAKPRPKLTEEQKKARRDKVDAETVKVFEAMGFKDIKPRVNVRTYDKWLEGGRQVRKGEKGTKVNRWRLFHESQTDPVGTVH